MIGMEQINGEIAALEEEKPTHVVMQKLASLYVVRDHMILGGEPPVPVMPHEAIVVQNPESSEFMQLVSGMDVSVVMSIMDELMNVLQTVNPKLYQGVMRMIRGGV